MCAPRVSIRFALWDPVDASLHDLDRGRSSSLERLVRTTAKKVARLMLGWGFILVGIVGLFVPILQGVLFLVVGLVILSSEYVWAARLLQRLRTRFPGLSARFEQAAANAHKWANRWFHYTKREASGETNKTWP